MSVNPNTQTGTTLDDLAAAVSKLQVAVDDLKNQVAALTPLSISDAVANRLLGGSGLAGLPDDMGLPADQQLGKPLQNYLVWSAHNGTAWAMQSAEIWLGVAVMLDAMNSASDNISKINAAQKAAADLRNSLRG